MTLPSKFQVIGRPDGLGNRVEELIIAAAVCEKLKCSCFYVWKNVHANRSYDALMSIPRVLVTEQADPSLPTLRLAEMLSKVDRSEIVKAARTLTCSFELRFASHDPPIGVHIRATDRIGGDHPHFMKDAEELVSYVKGAAKALNELGIIDVYVCGEDQAWVDTFLKYLNPQIRLTKAHASTTVPAEYLDYFALAHCKEIWMVSRFSSFSTTAALVGGVPIHCFYRDEAIATRYPAEFQYHNLEA